MKRSAPSAGSCRCRVHRREWWWSRSAPAQKPGRSPVSARRCPLYLSAIGINTLSTVVDLKDRVGSFRTKQFKQSEMHWKLAGSSSSKKTGVDRASVSGSARRLRRPNKNSGAVLKTQFKKSGFLADLRRAHVADESIGCSVLPNEINL